jgi:hypothetical protein
MVSGKALERRQCIVDHNVSLVDGHLRIVDNSISSTTGKCAGRKVVAIESIAVQGK